MTRTPRLYVVREDLKVANLYEVMATSQADAIAQVRDGGEALDMEMTDAWPTGRYTAGRGHIEVVGNE